MSSWLSNSSIIDTVISESNLSYPEWLGSSRVWEILESSCYDIYCLQIKIFL